MLDYNVLTEQHCIKAIPLHVWHTKKLYEEIWVNDDTQTLMGARKVKSPLDSYFYTMKLLFGRSKYYVIKVDHKIAGYFRIRNTKDHYTIGYALCPKFYGTYALDVVFNKWLSTHKDKYCLAIVRRCNIHSQNFLKRSGFRQSLLVLPDDCVCFIRK